MTRAEEAAGQIRRAAEREHSGRADDEDRRESDRGAAAAHPVVTDKKLRKGHPRGKDWRDKPVDSERDKDLKEGGIEGAARKARGRA